MEASMEVSAHRGAAIPSPGAVGPVLAAPAPAPPRHAGAHGASSSSPSSSGSSPGSCWRPPGTPGGSSSAGAAEVASSTTATPPSQASTSTRGVTATSINVVFPVVAINSLAGKEGFAEDKEYNEQIPAIHLYVNQINDAGGINGRKINPIIVQFDPTNDANMQSLCRQWTQGSPAVFAVVDGVGTWEGDDQLCVAQQGQTPLHQRLVHHDQLDQPGLALPVVDRCGHGTRAGRRRAVGGQLGAPRPRQEGRRRRLGPGGGPGRAERLHAARPEEGGHHAGGRDGGRQRGPDRHHQLRRASWPSRSSRPPACSR